jgi:predicted Zn finger-like uncharacterized protein
MQIVCPACNAAYEVPQTLLKPGKPVRCARCTRQWVPSIDAPEAGPDMMDTYLPPDEAPMAGTDVVWPARGSPGRAGVALRVAWAASVVAVLLLVTGAVAGRAGIMQAWPPSIRLYAALGLASDR